VNRSSLNWISGDAPLGKWEARAWIWLNRLSASLRQPSLQPILAFRPRSIAYPSEYIPAVSSPSRVLSNLFWQSLDAERIRTALGPLRLLDVGCGKGGYMRLLAEAIGPLESYRGIDIKKRPSWAEIEASDPRCSFVETSATTLGPDLLDDVNFVFSQSALEHFKDDLSLVRSITGSLRRRPRPMVQVHLVPPPLSWRLYGPHGYRGYGQRQIGRLLGAFQRAQSALFVLGGAHANQCHYRWIADYAADGLRDRRETDLDRYAEDVRASLARDLETPPKSIAEAAFVAIVVCSGTDLPPVNVVGNAS
jgi:SAM-dependent methyltransferase